MKYIKAIAMRINELLQIKGITEEEFIRKSKLPKETVERILSCEADDLYLETQFRVVRGLGVGLYEFHDSELFSMENLDDERGTLEDKIRFI